MLNTETARKDRVWTGTNSRPTHLHASLNGRTAVCNSRVKPADDSTPRSFEETRKPFLPPVTFCERCAKEVQQAADRMDASMAPRGLGYLND